MKVLFIQDIGDTGGATNSLKEMILNLNKKYNIEPVIVTSEYNSVNEFAKKNGFENYNVNHMPMLISMEGPKLKIIIKKFLKPLLKLRYRILNNLAIKKLEKKIDFNKIDVIHTNVNRDSIGLLLSKKYKIKHVLHIREFSDLDYKCSPLEKRYIDLMNRYTDRFIAISNIISTHWQNKGLEKSKIKVIYNGIDDKTFMPKEKKNESSDSIKIIFNGKICKSKGQEQIIEALAKMDPILLEKIKVDFYGKKDMQYYKFLKDKIMRNNLENIVNFYEYNREINKIVPEYDIGVISSKSEAFGRVTIEYMLSKLCVIASNTGANPELIDSGVNGFLYKYENPDSLKECLENLINNRKLLVNIANNGFNHAKNNFTSLINVERIYNLYCSLM